jgi:hypothetical protein
MEIPMPTPLPHPSRWPAGGLGVAEGGIMPTYPPLPGNVQTIGYSENGVLHVDVIVDHVVVQTVSLDLRRLIEHREMIAVRAAQRPAVQIDPASLAGTSATTNPHYWPAKEE